jgi:hypothetical protein
MDKLFPKTKDADGSEQGDSWRRRNTLESIAHLFADNDKNTFPETKGTAYSLLNSVTNYADHSRITRVTDCRPNYTATQGRAESALFGSGAALKESALEIILEETAKNPTRQARRILAAVPSSPVLDSIIADSIQ